jgi:uroporphyrinogen decarboxylase
MLTHRQRLEKCLSNQRPDRTPVALWRHFPVDDQTPNGLARATLIFQEAFDFDLVKVSPASSFCIKDWGVEDQWNGDSEGTRDYTKSVIREPEDWEKLSVLNVHQGHLGAQLDCLRILVKELEPDTPVIQTIFNPLSQAKNLVGKEKLLVHMRAFPEAVHAGLKVITETTYEYIQAVSAIGVSGIFFAVQHAQYGLLNEIEFEAFGSHYDLQALEAASDLWLNMVHLHGKDVMVKQIAEYPVQIFNWHDRETSPSLSQGKQLFEGVVCGGLQRQETIVLGTPESVREEALQAIEATDGMRFILGTGCVVPTVAPYGNLLAARQSVGF